MAKPNSLEAAIEVVASTTKIPAKTTKQYVRATAGAMYDPFTGVVFTQTPQPVDLISSWVQSQLDANKLVLVDA